MKTQARASRSRVIVAVGPDMADPMALAAAARLARAAGSELTALFVEDVNLLRLAESPFAYEICAASGTSRRLLTSDVERAFKSQADELRRALIDVAETLQLNLTFEIARGQPVSALLAASDPRDLVVLASAAVRTLVRASAPNIMRDALRAPKPNVQLHRPQPVTAVLQSAASASRVLAAAHTLAHATTAELMLLLAGGRENAELAAMARGWLATQQTSARITLLPELTAEGASTLIAESQPHALFWPGDGESGIAAEIDALLATITCPLVLVR